MTNEFGEQLKRFLRDELPQKTIAFGWHERVGKQWSPNHVESQLSRCLNGKLIGVKFFFEQRERGVALLRVMGVPENEHGRLLALADEAIASNGTQAPKMIVDVTPWAGTIEPKRIFEAIRIAIVNSPQMKPAALLVTPAQWEELPRSFDREEWLDVKPTEVVEELPADVLVVSPAEVIGEHWVAMGFENGSLVLEPRDGIERFARDGSLRPPPVAFDLADYVTAEVPSPRTPTTILERRRWMTQLGTEDAALVDPDPRMRLAIARSLKVPALATSRDRIEHELAAIAMRHGALPKVVGPDELDQQLSRARRYPTKDVWLRLGDELHVVNPGGDVVASPRFNVHRVDLPVPAITRLRTALEAWTIGDIDDDPLMLRLIEELGRDAHDHLALLHARATLCRGPELKPCVATRIEDWRRALHEIVEADPPEAYLRFRQRWTSKTLPPWGDAALASLDAKTADILRFAWTPFDHIVVDRSQTIGGTRETSSQYDRTNFVAASPDSEDAWIDAFDGLRTRYDGVRPLEFQKHELDRTLWATADREVALTWFALRDATRSTATVRLADGTVMVRLGNGLGLTVNATRTSRELRRAVILETNTDQKYYGSNKLVRRVPSGVRGYGEVTYDLPLPFVLHQGHVRLEIEIIAAPVFGVPSAALFDGVDDEDEDAE